MAPICQQCGKRFKERKGRNMFCNRKCRDASFRKVDLDLLVDMVARGDMAKNMAVDLGISRGRVHNVLLHRGLLKQWRENRYRTAGTRSAITASEAPAPFGPFAR